MVKNPKPENWDKYFPGSDKPNKDDKIRDLFLDLVKLPLETMKSIWANYKEELFELYHIDQTDRVKLRDLKLDGFDRIVKIGRKNPLETVEYSHVVI